MTMTRQDFRENAMENQNYYDIDGKEIIKEEFEEFLKNNLSFTCVGYVNGAGSTNNYIVKK